MIAPVLSTKKKKNDINKLRLMVLWHIAAIRIELGSYRPLPVLIIIMCLLLFKKKRNYLLP